VQGIITKSFSVETRLTDKSKAMNQNTHTPGLPDFNTVWHCVRTQPKREHIAAAQISRLETLEVFAPRIRFRRRTPRGKVWFEESLFPGYIFARFDGQMLRAVSSAVGVRGLVRFAGRCAEVPEAMIELLRSETAEQKVIVIPDEPSVKAGDEAVVAEGALMGLQAVITRVMPGGERVKILLDMMGTAVEAEVPLDTLEKIA
jgi:transcriptional antiterminator RfaH